ncbi:hypothetical protein ACFWDI_21690 [Streptomyces sp. NPDC060064]|uniref:hypothetical protein n=1 Tax=Streptomyces sp. NPDC060064 TaxID=3347049 RepID=UPI0036A3283C
MSRAELRSLLAELDQRGPYERGLAVVAAAVGGDAEWVGARLADPDSFVRGRALRVAASLGAPTAVREQLLRAMVAAPHSRHAPPKCCASGSAAGTGRATPGRCSKPPTRSPRPTVAPKSSSP